MLFKTGDKVILVKNEFNRTAAKIGATAIYLGIHNDWTQFEWIRNGLDCGQADGSYYDGDFELAIDNFTIYKRLLNKLYD